MSFFGFGGTEEAAPETAEGQTYGADDLLMRQHAERNASEQHAHWEQATSKSVDASKQFYQQNIQQLMEKGDTRKHHPAPGAEAFDGHAEAAVGGGWLHVRAECS
jgi:hypothetical protein